MEDGDDYFSDEKNFEELVGHMPDEDQHRFNKYGHFRIEAAFINRVLIVYKPTGEASDGKRMDPKILTTVKFTDFRGDPRGGCYAVLQDLSCQQDMIITHIPQKLFKYPIYISIPPRMSLRWDCKLVNDRPWRSLSFAFLIKTKNKSDFYSMGNTYAETPKEFGRLFPDFMGSFDFK